MGHQYHCFPGKSMLDFDSMHREDLRPEKLPHQISQKHEIDLDLFAFIERYVTNPIKWDILAHFGEAPHITSTTQDLAQLLGRNYPITRRNVGDLVLFGILTIVDTQSSTFEYRLCDDPPLRTQVMKLAQFTDSGIAERW